MKLMVAVLSLAVGVSNAAAAEGPMLSARGIIDTPLPALMSQLEEARSRQAADFKPSPNVVLEGAEPAFIFSVVGTAGAFRTEGVLVNRRSQAQTIAANGISLFGDGISVREFSGVTRIGEMVFEDV